VSADPPDADADEPLFAASTPAARTSIRASRSGAFAMPIVPLDAFALVQDDERTGLCAGAAEGCETGALGATGTDATLVTAGAAEACTFVVATGAGDDPGVAALIALSADARSERTSALTPGAFALAVALVCCWAGMSFAEMASKMVPESSFCCPAPFDISLASDSTICCSRAARAAASSAAVPGGALLGGESAFAMVCVIDV
jgi:hypothetical protein